MASKSDDLSNFGKYKAPKRAGELKRRSLAIVAVLALLWVVLDQLSKHLAQSLLSSTGASADIVPGLFHFQLAQNTGGAWSILSGATWLLALFSVVVCLAILAYVVMRGQYLNLAQIIGLGLVLGGGIGNLVDRLMQGSVTDFIAFSFIDFPVFNIADIGVTCGIVIFIIGLLVGSKGTPSSDSTPREGLL